MFTLKHQTDSGTSVHAVECVHSERRRNSRTGQPYDVLVAFGGTLQGADGPATLFGGTIWIMNDAGKTVAVYTLGDPGAFGADDAPVDASK